MKVVEFDNQYLDKVAKLVSNEFSEWTKKSAKEFIRLRTDKYPKYCFIALDSKGSCTGGVFCRLVPFHDNYSLYIDLIIVKPEYRKKGIGKKIFSRLFTQAKKGNIQEIRALLDVESNFPLSWFENLGFELTRWREYKVEFSNLAYKRLT